MLSENISLNETQLYLDIPFELRYFFIIWLAGAIILGVITNVSILTAVMTTKTLQRDSSLLVGIQAAIDLLVNGCVSLPTLLIYADLLSATFYSQHCPRLAYLTMLSLEASLYNYMLIAINRYIFVTKPRSFYNRFFANWHMAVPVSLIILLPALMAMPPILSFGTYGFNLAFTTCIFLDCDRYSYWYIVGFGCCAVGFPAVGFSLTAYLGIFSVYTKSQRQVGNSANDSGQNAGGPVRSINRNSIQLAKNLFMVWAVFLLFWGPLILVVLVDANCGVPRTVVRTFFIMAISVSSLNPLLILLYNKQFNCSFKGNKRNGNFSVSTI